jgi:hypothetical protein
MAVVVVVAALGLAACGSDKESQAEAKQNLCQSLDHFSASVASLQGLSLKSSSEDDLTSAADNVNDAWKGVVEDAKQVKSASTDAIDSAYKDLTQAIQDRPTDKPVTEVIAGIQPKLAAFAQAWKDFANSLDCNSTS